MDTSNYTPERCFVYAVRGRTGKIKIGIAKDIKKRIDEMQVASHETLCFVGGISCGSRELALKVEALFHKLYAAYHIRGEWYGLSDQAILRDINFFIDVFDIIVPFAPESTEEDLPIYNNPTLSLDVAAEFVIQR